MLRIRLIPLSVAVSLLSVPAVAQTTPGATERCADMTDNAARLACYDRAARGEPAPTTRAPSRTGPIPTTRVAPRPAPPAGSGGSSSGGSTTGGTSAGSAPGAATAGAWQVLSEARATGGENLFLLTYATGGRRNAEKPALTINCERGQLTLYVRWTREAGAKLHRVTYTIDGGQPQVMAMAHSKDTYATGLWHPRGAANFTKRLAGHDRLAVSFTGADGEPMAAVFNISGLDQVMGRLRAACKF